MPTLSDVSGLFFCPLVVENKFHWWKPFCFISGKGILFLGTAKSTGHFEQQIYVQFGFFFSFCIHYFKQNEA